MKPKKHDKLDVSLLRKWHQWVEDDWDWRLEKEGNPYTFASKKKFGRKGYIEDLHALALNYARRNRFKLWEQFYNLHLKPTKATYSKIMLKRAVNGESDWISFPETADYDSHPLFLYETKNKTLLDKIKETYRSALFWISVWMANEK